MGCGTCTTENGVPKGCKSNGQCGVVGCGMLDVHDWLADIALPGGQSIYDVVEIRFKNGRKSFYRNMKDIPLQAGDAVVVEASPGFDIGIVSIVGELARIQVRKKSPGFKPHEARKVLRKASKEDLSRWKDARAKEQQTMYRSRELASELALQMKISDVEYQGDATKATFYYTAEDRIDFRQLIKDLADAFKVRIEMKQIGVRQESARLGGIGSCGRELCCATWLTDFRSVSTAAARYQQLSLNPQKLAGQCGKLKCCLNYELDSYLDALKKFPNSEIKLHTEKGTAFHIKTDVFKQQMWYLQEERKEDVTTTSMVPLSPEIVKEIIEMNKAGKKPADLKAYLTEVEVEEPDYTNVVGQDSLNRFDNAFKKKKKKKKKSKNPNQTPQQQGQQQGQQQKPQGQGNQQARQGQPNKGQQNKPQQAKKDQTKQPAQKQGGTNQTQNKKQSNQNQPKKGNDQNPNQQKKANDQNRNRNNNHRNNRPKQDGNSGNTQNNAKKDQ
ncbi:MAG: hypothetical protein IPM74_11085 [Crocinitomicaceae bacterium]|nr:hypothetical protein [Crocinitomicaceae bacterium]MBK8926426.1 hypothetical protein [Crocinitomicaceae bacterium]